MTRRRGPLGSTITTWTSMSGGRWIVLAWATGKLSAGWTWRNRWPTTFWRRFPDTGGRIGAGFRVGPLSVSILPIQTDAEAAKPFDPRPFARPRPWTWTSRSLAILWFAFAVFGALVVPAAGQVGGGRGALIVLVGGAAIGGGVFMAVGNWTGLIRLDDRNRNPKE